MPSRVLIVFEIASPAFGGLAMTILRVPLKIGSDFLIQGPHFFAESSTENACTSKPSLVLHREGEEVGSQTRQQSSLATPNGSASYGVLSTKESPT